MSKKNPPAGSVCFYDLPSTSIEATRKFYAEAFAWSFHEMGGYMFVNDGSPEGGAQIMGGIRPAQDFDRGVPVLTYIAVDSVDATSKKILRAGGKLISERVTIPGYGTFVVFQAPGGPSQAIWQAEKPAAETTADAGTAIRQEVTIAASVASVYQAIADFSEFGKVTGAPATGAPKEGEAFTAFGGHVLGRQVELVPSTRIVQAWRAKSWVEGVYSIIRFDLVAEGKKTRLVFTQEGFPAEMREHLTQGWEANYWAPLKKHLEH